MARLICIITFFLFSMILLINIAADFTEYTWKRSSLIPNGILIVIAGIVWYLFSAKRGREHHALVWPIVPCTILLFLLQMGVCYSIFFETGWDPAAVIAEVRNIIGNKGINWQWYFQAYPNNLALAQVEYWILRINGALNLFSGDYELMAVVMVNCIISSMTCMLVYLTGRSLFSANAKVSWTLWVLAVLLFGLSPWLVIAYTDSLGLIFPILGLYMYLWLMRTEIVWKKVIGWSALLVMEYCGYLIKPQAMIIVAAIGIVETLRHLRNHCKGSGRKWKHFFLILFIVCIVVTGIRREQNYWKSSRGFISDIEKSMDPLHYLNMGLNTEQDGAFLQSDLDRSAKFATKKQRDCYNLQSAGERAKELRIGGMLKHLAKKMMVVYADGTFAWGCEPDFWQTVFLEKDENISGLLREFYYEDGTYYRVFETVEQAVWIFVLVGGWISSMSMLLKKRRGSYYAMALALIGITIFEILFEARARYLYLYAPIFVLMTGYTINGGVRVHEK